MFSFKSKLESSLKYSLSNNLHNYHRVIIKYKCLEDKIQKKIKALKCETICHIPSINCLCANLSTHAIERLIEYPEVSYIYPDNYAFLCGEEKKHPKGILFQNTPLKSKNNKELTGKGIGIGIIDTGVYPHPDLINPYNRIKKFKDVINHLNFPYDDNGHGTFITGLICGSGFSSKNTFRGVSPNSDIYSIKAFNKLGKAFFSDILFSLETLIIESQELNIRIICLPFEIFNTDSFILSSFSKLFDLAISKGIIIIVPSGNNGTREDSIKGISALNNCLTIGGLDTTKTPKVYDYSSCGSCKKNEKPDFIAPCVNIISLDTDELYVSEKNGNKIYPHHKDNLYTTYSGTSIAAGYVAALCALLYENNPNLTYKDIVALLKISCNIINTPKYMQGSGVVNLNNLIL